MAFKYFLTASSVYASGYHKFLIMNRVLLNHTGVCLRPYIADAEKFGKFPFKVPCQMTSVQMNNLGHQSQGKVRLLTCGVNVKPTSGGALLDSGKTMNVHLCPPSLICFSGISRSFCQVSRAGTRNLEVMIEDAEKKTSELFKTIRKPWKRHKGFSSHKVNATSKQELVCRISRGKTSFPGAENDNLPTAKGPIVQNNTNSLTCENTQTYSNRVEVTTESRIKSSENLLSSAATPTDTTNLSANLKTKSQKKNTRNTKSKPSPEVNSNSNILAESINNKNSLKNVPKVTQSSPKKENKGSRVRLLSNKRLDHQSEENVSTGQNLCRTSKIESSRKRIWPQFYPPITKSVLVVESATKAKVIQEYLGQMFEVVPSYGHVRDLAARSGSVRPDDDFSMVWEVPSAAWSHLKSIKVALSGAENIILASDPDREGEAIAWHIIEMLRQQDSLRDDVNIARIVFNEITESSIKTALLSPREIDTNLVNAYLARRALDYLIGFSVSPLLWRKLPGCQSAGRVQSAALALICDREKEIDEFKAQEYWTVEVEFHKKDINLLKNVSLSSQLTHFESKKRNQLSICSQVEVEDIKEKIKHSTFEVVGSKISKIRKNPPTPYITSTLQQDAANKLNFTASYTMKVAQKLYEGVQLMNGQATGLITYMRTDGLYLSDDIAKDIQTFVTEKYGRDFASKNIRKYFKKVKNAQEAHEAIRPTDIRRLPSMLGLLDEDSLMLYTLIWSRTMACQMEPAVIEQIQLDVGNANQSMMFRSTSSKVDFLGYRSVYKDVEAIKIKSYEDQEDGSIEMFEILRNLKRGQLLCLAKVKTEQHYTEPLPRYSEGSLVKKLEELGIGRPSTYATTIKVLKDRNYITMKSRTLFPEFRGRMVSAFLSHYFSEVTDYSFTADMENELDNVSAGMTEWKGLLRDYWTRFREYFENAGKVHIHHIEKMLEKKFCHFLFASLRDGSRTCPSCLEGTLVFKVSRFGAGYFIGCDQHPKCKYIAKTLYGEDDDDTTPENKKDIVQEPKLLGLNPLSNEKVLLKNGPYGYYVQLGEDRKGHLPKRASVSQIKNVDSITLEVALDLLQYPVTLGNHPDDGQPIILKLAKVGFTVRHRRTIASVPKNMKPSEVSIEKAVKLLQSKDVRKCGRPKRKLVMEESIEAV